MFINKQNPFSYLLILSCFLLLNNCTNPKLDKKSCDQLPKKAQYATKSCMLLLVEKNGQILYDASESLKDDKDVVLVAVKQDGAAIMHVSQRLKGDPDVILVVVENYAIGIIDADTRNPAIANNKKIFLTAMSFPGALHYAGPQLLADKDFMRQAIKLDANALCLADEKLKKDEQLMALAMNNPHFDKSCLQKRRR